MPNVVLSYVNMLPMAVIIAVCTHHINNMEEICSTTRFSSICHNCCD